MKVMRFTLFFILVLQPGCKQVSMSAAETEFKPEASTSTTGCPSHFEDSEWKSLNPRLLERDVEYAVIAVGATELIGQFGVPDEVYEKDGKKIQVWNHGAVRRTRTKECDGSIKDVYTTEYHLLKITSKSGEESIENCLVSRRVFMSDSVASKPVDTKGLLDFLSSDIQCKSWLKNRAG